MPGAAPHAPYPIGRPGRPWGEDERRQWLDAQRVQRSYRADVLNRLDRLDAPYRVHRYGALPIQPERYPLHAIALGDEPGRPTVLVTGGVHGYETSGVHGALAFLETHAPDYVGRFNLLVVPCVSPWGYETINRWNPQAVDPNRAFFAGSDSPEATLLMAFLAEYDSTTWGRATASFEATVHFDLHETTDTDNSEFRPALNARDGRAPEVLGEIPPGFYTVAPTAHPELAFQEAVIRSVGDVTPIARPDPEGNIIGCPVQSPGIIYYDKQALHLCGGLTHARYVTTTEVYPDAPNTSPATCIEAQVAAIRGGLDFLVETGAIPS